MTQNQPPADQEEGVVVFNDDDNVDFGEVDNIDRKQLHAGFVTGDANDPSRKRHFDVDIRDEYVERRESHQFMEMKEGPQVPRDCTNLTDVKAAESIQSHTRLKPQDLRTV